jgi:hypothetical protein
VKNEFLRSTKMQRLMFIAVLAMSAIIIGCSPTNMTLITPGNAEENNVNVISPTQSEEHGNWDAYYNEGMGY